MAHGFIPGSNNKLRPLGFIRTEIMHSLIRNTCSQIKILQYLTIMIYDWMVVKLVSVTHMESNNRVHSPFAVTINIYFLY